MFTPTFLSCCFKVSLLFVLLGGLSSCTLDNELYSDHYSRELVDAPKLMAMLEKSGVIDKEGGFIQVYLYNAQGQRARLDDQPLPNNGKQVDSWAWRMPQGFALAPDSFRDKVKAIAKEYPPNAYLLPGSLGPFLVLLCHAAE